MALLAALMAPAILALGLVVAEASGYEAMARGGDGPRPSLRASPIGTTSPSSVERSPGAAMREGAAVIWEPTWVPPFGRAKRGRREAGADDASRQPGRVAQV